MSKDTTIPDEWATSTGFALSAGADAEIIGAVFGFNDKLGAGVMCLNLTFSVEDAEPVDQSFSIGNGWEITEKGDLIVTADGKSRGVNKSTNLGLLIDSIVGGGPFIDRGPLFDGEPPFDTPRRASNWIGTRWTIGNHEVKRKNPATGIEKVSEAIVFDAYLGRSDEAPKGAKGKPAAAGKLAGKPAAKKADDTYGIDDDDLRGQIVDAAKGADGDHAAFIEECYKFDGVDGDAAVEKAIYNKKPGSLWAAVMSGDL